MVIISPNGPHGDILQVLSPRSDGTFADITKKIPCSTSKCNPHTLLFPDVNRDGATDLFVSNPNFLHLFVNDGHGKFTDATKTLKEAYATFGYTIPSIFDAAAVGDFDGDGDDDFFGFNALFVPGVKCGGDDGICFQPFVMWNTTN